jgi:DNA-binding LacI/PurR family transcriptional regulator
MQRVTRNDVAKRAGVSPAVVSYVMNNSNYVSEQKRKAVMKAIEELNYTPNIFAKGLKTNRSNQIALIGDTLQGELYGELSARIFDRGYYPVLFFSRKEDAFIDKLIIGRFDAVFMASNSFDVEQLNRIAENGIPLILYQSRNYTGLDPRIVIRAPALYDGVKETMNYLISKGHRRIAYVPPVKYITEGVMGDDFRAQAYRDALTENGIEIHREYFCTHTQDENSILEDVFRMLNHVDADHRPTAFFASDDHIAAQIMQYVKKCDLRVPEDVAIVGWGNIASSYITTPELTTVDSEIIRFADDLSDALIRMTQGEHPENKLYTGKLIIRGST